MKITVKGHDQSEREHTLTLLPEDPDHVYWANRAGRLVARIAKAELERLVGNLHVCSVSRARIP